MVKMAGTMSSSVSIWIVDTGATDHMVSSISKLTTITSFVSSSVRMPNGSFARGSHIGTVQVSPNILLQNVLVISSFSFNIVSVNSLIKQISCCLIFLHITSLYRTYAIG